MRSSLLSTDPPLSEKATVSRISLDQTNDPTLQAAIRQLTVSNNALHSVVLELSDLLHDTSRFSSYSPAENTYGFPHEESNP